jgi:peptidoglycan/LPS O-acetylase OafA/YrhL
MDTVSTTASPIIEKADATLYTPQVCRGLACLLVAIYHGAALVGNWYGVKPLLTLTNFGFSGVHMFFVISGLIIAHAHRDDMDNYRCEWRSRSAEIWRRCARSTSRDGFT